MDDRILLIPPDWAPDPSVYEEWPAAKALLRELRAFLPIDLFRPPSLMGEARDGDPIELVLLAFRQQLRRQHHVVAIVAREQLVQVLAEDPTRSFVTAGFVPAPATAVGMGEDTLARALAAQNAMSANVAQIVPMVMQGAAESQIEKVIADLRRTCDFAFVTRLRAAGEALPEQTATPIEMPALYLSPAAPINPGDDSLFHVFRTWFPDAGRDELIQWGVRLHEEAGGMELANKVIPFIKEVIATRASA